MNMLKQYDGTLTNINYNYINITTILNDFNHLLSEHKSQKDFEYICNSFSLCNIDKFNIMKRYYINRKLYINNNNTKNNNQSQYRDILYQQIIDRIHCHFMHSYDFGYKTKDKNDHALK